MSSPAQAAASANSPAGIDYALSNIAGVASGEQGSQAISDIVSKFERPANPAPEISKDISTYPQAQQAVSLLGTGSAFDRIVKAIFTAPAQVFQGVSGHNVNASPTGPNSVLGAAGASGSGIASFLGIPLPSNAIVRGGEMLAGGVLILLGLIMITLGGRGTPQTQAVRAVRTVAR